MNGRGPILSRFAVTAVFGIGGCLATSFVAGCSGADPGNDPGQASAKSDRAGQGTRIPKSTHASVCNNGRWRCKSQVLTTPDGKIRSFAQVQGFGPPDLASAYNLDTSVTSTATVAVVDAYGYKNAESDLAEYRKQFGLPPCTTANGCFKIVNQKGETSPLPSAPPSGDDWTVEAALDLDLASAACPSCKLLLVEADDDRGDGLFLAQDGAATAGAVAVSNSWGGPDDGTGIDTESHFNHDGMSEFVATGDSGNTGDQPDYPSTSQFVTGVGGTSLVQSSGDSRGWTESAWGGAGSSCSKTIAKPSFQTDVDTTCSFRAASDVSAVADPNTGLAVYNAEAGGWLVVGGTSASSPFVAGVYALTGHAGAGPSLSYTQSSLFFDVTSGSNGSCHGSMCNAGTGWDGPTGMGTPNGKALAAHSGN